MERLRRLAGIGDERIAGTVLLLGLESVLGWVLPGVFTGTLQPLRAAIFLALALAHGALMLAASWRGGGRWMPVYLAAQISLVWAIVMLAGTPYALYLYATLGAQALVLLYGAGWRAWPAVAACEAAGFAQFVTLWGWQDAPAFLFAAAPQAGFVAGFAALYMRQSALRRQAVERAQQLEHAQRRLAAYAEQVEDLTRAAERRRMARDLHDTLAQGLAGIILQLEAVEAQLGKGRAERALAIVNMAMARARETMAEARGAIDDLRAGGSSLAERLELETRRFSAETGVPCRLAMDAPGDLPDTAAEAAFRVVREGLSNVARHAHASAVDVRVALDGGLLTVVVRDDGVGPASAGEAAQGHYGLLGLRERAALAGGSLTMDGSAGGTTLTLRVPLNEDGDE